jgi:holo-[acyl-carrier protein] synthase
VSDRPSVRVGIDLVDVGRLRRALERRPRLAERVFTDAERAASDRGVAAERLAARFAAKEAAMKALGVGLGAFALRDVEVRTAADGSPSLELRGRARDRATRLGVDALAVSLTHTASVASAVVVASCTA